MIGWNDLTEDGQTAVLLIVFAIEVWLLWL
jgi:hypothetical protein